MPRPSPRRGQCIFCAFRTPKPWPSRCSNRSQIASLSSSSSSLSRRTEPPIRKTGGPPLRREDRGYDTKSLFNSELESRKKYRKANKSALQHVVLHRLEALVPELQKSPVLERPRISDEEAARTIARFRQHISSNLDPPVLIGKPDESTEKLARTLSDIYIDNGVEGLDAHLKHVFYGFVIGESFSESDRRNQKAVADLRYPIEWFPQVRSLQRTIHVHIGPTNSGKTYHALKRLEEAKRGVYSGPLRLLAHEVYSRFQAQGKSCMLVTGEEQRMPPEWATADSTIISCTVEMTPLNSELDVAVIDEIQMLGSKERGWAWTSALTGVRAKEVHVCGEERALPLVQQIAAATGDKLEIHRYERLTPLKCETESLGGDFKKLRKGDCVVTFSVVAIHALRDEIEKISGKKVAVVYGGLPPETRAQQARLFNEPDNDYDYLVASDAIGMGLNLSIKRVIFESVRKHNGQKVTILTNSEIKQIAGRAGRYRTANQNTQAATTSLDARASAADFSNDKTALDPTQPEPKPFPSEEANFGLVTTLEKLDLPILVRAMADPGKALTSAGVLPPNSLLQRFSNYFPPETPFSYILIRLNEISQIHPRYHLCLLGDQVKIADAIHPVKGLTIDDRIVLCAAPASMRQKAMPGLVKELAICIADQKGGSILEISALKLELLGREMRGNRESLRELEVLHMGIVLYMWLSFRFPGIFTTRPLANHVKDLVEERIEKTLSMMSFDQKERKKDRARLRAAERLDTARRDLLLTGEFEIKAAEVQPGDDTTPIDGGTALQDGLATAGHLDEANEILSGNPGVERETRDDEGKYPENDIETEDDNASELKSLGTPVRNDEADTKSFEIPEDWDRLVSSEGSTTASTSKPSQSAA